ncbi:MAG TPA: hypothetical protein VM580_14370, partial [Labilithrix sp.]|nr:hypothetical protein [Labilithrix sp.]
WRRGRNQYNEPTDGATRLSRECEWCSAEFVVECRRARRTAGIGGRRVVGRRPGVRETIAETAKE